MYLKICAVCEKTFETQHENVERPICYGCVLHELIGNALPEEGDINAAYLISGEMNDQKWKWLKEDFRAVETGCSIREFDPPELIDWCRRCGESVDSCWCDYEEEEE